MSSLFNAAMYPMYRYDNSNFAPQQPLSQQRWCSTITRSVWCDVAGRAEGRRCPVAYSTSDMDYLSHLNRNTSSGQGEKRHNFLCESLLGDSVFSDDFSKNRR